MEQICFSSDVSHLHFTINADTLKEIKSLDGDLFKWKDIISYNGSTLKVLLEELKPVIESLLSDRSLSEKVNSIVNFNGTDYSFNLYNDKDFHVNALIDIYNLGTHTDDVGGCLVLFNKSYFNRFFGDSIIAFLRYRTGLSEIELLEGLNTLWNSLNLKKKIEAYSLQKGLKNLCVYGLVYFDTKSRKYYITSRGYLYW